MFMCGNEGCSQPGYKVVKLPVRVYCSASSHVELTNSALFLSNLETSEFAISVVWFSSRSALDRPVSSIVFFHEALLDSPTRIGVLFILYWRIFSAESIRERTSSIC